MRSQFNQWAFRILFGDDGKENPKPYQPRVSPWPSEGETPAAAALRFRDEGSTLGPPPGVKERIYELRPLRADDGEVRFFHYLFEALEVGMKLALEEYGSKYMPEKWVCPAAPEKGFMDGAKQTWVLRINIKSGSWDSLRGWAVREREL